ncbi:hypothetical protein RvY_02824 [Ramazzottius varieornatus]|uniref:Uncharacterized protein n=1 Tax=Ramazzottius varieornatus TaxID=947166 RepID=A0A1D1UL28_RAMVA|nr:hypothetical protein RvY_02824 [Ramazzottius varieornatus]
MLRQVSARRSVMAVRWPIWTSVLTLLSVQLVSGHLHIEPPSDVDAADLADNSTMYTQGRAGDSLRLVRPAKHRSSEADYPLIPAMMNDPLGIAFCVQPDDWIGLSILGILKVHQMFKTVGAPLTEPYQGRSEGGPPAPPAAPGPAAPAPSNNFNPWVPYMMMMYSGGYGRGGESGRGRGGFRGGGESG